MPDAATVGLNTDLHEAFPALLAHGFDSQNRRVGVGTDHRDRVARLSPSLTENSRKFLINTYLPLFANRKSHEGGSIAGQVILTSGLAGRRPGVFLLLIYETRFSFLIFYSVHAYLDLLESSLGQKLLGFMNGMES